MRIEQNNLEKKKVKISSNMKNKLKQRLVECLRAHANVFAWLYKDILEIDTRIVCHKLTINNDTKLVKYKRRFFKQEKYNAINSEMDKLL